MGICKEGARAATDRSVVATVGAPEGVGTAEGSRHTNSTNHPSSSGLRSLNVGRIGARREILGRARLHNEEHYLIEPRSSVYGLLPHWTDPPPRIVITL
jgi:hypothetical protein